MTAQAGNNNIEVIFMLLYQRHPVLSYPRSVCAACGRAAPPMRYKVTGPVTEVYMDSAALAYLVVRAAKH